MAEPYLGQIEAFAFGFAPRGWAICAGQLMAISQNQALFALLGTTYGGDGRSTFALPDLRSRIAMGQGAGSGLTPRVMGESGGAEAHTLLATEMPQHSHQLAAVASAAPAGNTNVPSNTVLLAQTIGKNSNGTTFALPLYVADPQPNQAMHASAIGATGGQPHANLMPYATLNFCIALQGIFPSRS